MGSDMIIYMRWDKDIVYVLSVSLVYIFKFPIFHALNVLSSFIWRLTVDISVVKNEVLYYKEEEEERNMKDETDDDGREEGRKKL